MIIKVCGMREKENTEQLVAEASPDLMGLIFYPPSIRYVEARDVNPAFFEKLPQHKVGVFVNAELDEIVTKINSYGLSSVQLHGDESPDFIVRLKVRTDALIIKVFRIGPDWDWNMVEPFVKVADWFLFDTETPAFGGSGKSFDWNVLAKYPFDVPFLLSGGVGEEQIDAINTLAERIPSCLGVDINSRFEISPGLKEITRIKTFIQKVRLGIGNADSSRINNKI